MLNHNPITQEIGECIVVGRAATAIYLVLSEMKQKNKYVLVPANICYAAVFPILSAGMIPLFCDVDRYSGNITEEAIIACINKDVVAAIIPHMYGNPVQDIKKIHTELSKNNIVLIEDCASLMTNIESDVMPGTEGDYVIYSTGYSKTIDVGYGGLLFSKNYSLSSMEKCLDELPLLNDEFEKETALFSKIYRIIRNQRHESKLAIDFYACLSNSFKSNFIYRIGEDKINTILVKIKQLDYVISCRKNKYFYYSERLKEKFDLYEFDQTAVPWRLNLFVNNSDKFISYCLSNGLPVSDWYPSVAPIFGDSTIFEGATWHERHIINFPLMIPDEEINNICEVLQKYDGDEKGLWKMI